MPLSKIHTYPHGPGTPVESCCEMQDEESAIPVERIVSVVRPRSRGERVAPVTGIKRCAQRSDENQIWTSSVYEVDARLIPLAEQGKAGWRQQTLKLYDALKPKLMHFLRRFRLNKEEMDDVVQESFLRLAGHLKKGCNDDNLSTWLYQVARNLAMDVHRVNLRDHQEAELELEPEDGPADPKANPEWVYLQKEQFRQLNAALSRLTTQQYNSILLRSQGMRYREIGSLLGISEQRAMHLVKRGIERLRGGQ